MTVADDAVDPSPPPPAAARARIVVLVLALARFVLAPMLALLLVVARALPYLGFGITWALSAIGAAAAAAHLAWGERSTPFVFLLALAEAAVKVCGTFLVVALAAVLLCGRFLVPFVPGSGPEFDKSPFEVIMEESTRGLSRSSRIVAIGWVAILALLPLIFAAILIMMVSSPVEGSVSQVEMIGSVIAYVGLFASHAIACFVIFPAMVLSVWRKDLVDRKELQFC